ncbi:DUF3817 domain-containing protein [Chitinophaga sp. Cy-1792]|uniref:DUF3817 domain-containing protein n=1 Tax=Chitinophaga sp. Cy-1792 TaxID=2608339 RepID=UPI0014245EF5|nr:DUF3817 domain-containing protein [Chitinophaga sp. Cy-1792]NIG54802.1 DUF3817 domain-containing protein [Chitinophaga sp. Cy-1792]
MKVLFQTRLGRLRLLGYLEGISLLLLVLVAVPAKYLLHDPAMVKAMGPVHGALFLLYIFNTLGVAVEQRWQFSRTTWKVMVACIIPFGTFYIDKKILQQQDN